MVFPLWFVPRSWDRTPFSGNIDFKQNWFWAVLSNAPPRGKRRVGPVLLTEKAGRAGLKAA
jgi:hypothetical protein